MLVSVFLAIAPILLLGGVAWLWRLWRQLDRRRDPFNPRDRASRGAGEGIRSSLAQLSDDFDTTLAVAIAAAPLFFSVWAGSKLEETGFRWSTYRLDGSDVLLLVVALFVYVAAAWRLINLGERARRLRRALDAELLTGQCLTQVMSEGGIVFHDFPADGFNIDHIVIGKSAVFAVETKSRMKPAAGGKDAARVVYDGEVLRFPEHCETKPVEQAARQADWLRRFLASGVGEPVPVIPYLALPGWFVDSKAQRPAVLVGNPKNTMFMARDGFGPALGEMTKRRIAHVLSERYQAEAKRRGVESGS